MYQSSKLTSCHLNKLPLDLQKQTCWLPIVTFPKKIMSTSSSENISDTSNLELILPNYSLSVTISKFIWLIWKKTPLHPMVCLRDIWMLFPVLRLAEINSDLWPGYFISSLDKSVRFWDVRSGFSEVLIDVNNSLPWDVKLWNGEKDLVVGCENGEIGVINLGN